MDENWTYPDLIDLEYWLSLDKELKQTDLHERDRQIYLDSPEEIKNDGRDQLIRRWLQERKEQILGGAAAKSPGQLITESYRTLAYLLSILGVILGFGAGLSFLAYSGTTPVNVLNFIFLFIFSQLLVMAFIFPTAALRMAGFSAMPAPIVSLYALISSWFSKHFTRLTAHVPADKLMIYNQAAGIWKKQHSRYRHAAYWPLFSLSQYTMSGFNFGLLTATLYRLLTSDIAFGWQSTIQFGPSFIHNTVRTLAMPWSWIVPHQYAYPSEAEIEGSRIILKDGIYHLATQDLVSWWPFLVLCIIVYGLLFRFILVLIGRLGRKRSLQKLQLNTPAVIQLVQRMQAPLVSSQAETISNHTGNQTEEVSTHKKITADFSVCTTLLLIPAEMVEHYGHDMIGNQLEASGFSVKDHKVFMAGYESDQNLIEELSSLEWTTDTGMAAVVEAWMPPITESLTFFKKLRSAVGPTVPIWVVLAGQSGSSGSLTKPLKTDWIVWRQKLDELADPYLDLVAL